ncbi:DMT family transporter [Bacillus clarus]|uniref:DMT family transporter n=1 Tax=Bacillus clarus TaxID=2338372 RepID=A0A090YA94_9BACI|nr:DMT family transporter [Bacillus clarus]KFM95693.1 eamA-like transporter family protein [Bacillus clarus]RFT62877.1 DMT family transporter [Bacillus clarus]
MSKVQYKKASLIGVGFVLIYNILSSIKEVVSGHVVQTISPFLLVTMAFGFAFVFFQILSFFKYKNEYKKPFQDYSTLIKVNISTVGAWIGFFYGVKYLEPAIVSTLIAGIGPAIATIYQGFFASKRNINPVENYSAFGILICSILLVWISLNGMTSVNSVNYIDITKGVILTFISSVCVVITTFYTKKLSGLGCSPMTIMAHRFYLLIPISLIAFLITNTQKVNILENLPIIIYIAVFGATIPLLCLQYGIKYCTPIMVVTLLAIAPLFTFLFEIADPRLNLSPVSGGLITLTTAICIISTLSSLKKEKQISTPSSLKKEKQAAN